MTIVDFCKQRIVTSRYAFVLPGGQGLVIVLLHLFQRCTVIGMSNQVVHFVTVCREMVEFLLRLHLVRVRPVDILVILGHDVSS